MAKLSKIFLKNLTVAISRSGISKAEIARRAGMLPQQLTVYLAGKSAPGLDVIERFAEALQLDAKDLLRDDSPIEPRKPVQECFQTLYALCVALDHGDTESPVVQELYAFVKELPKRGRKEASQKERPR